MGMGYERLRVIASTLSLTFKTNKLVFILQSFLFVRALDSIITRFLDIIWNHRHSDNKCIIRPIRANKKDGLAGTLSLERSERMI